jgi:hypothetical protein
MPEAFITLDVGPQFDFFYGVGKEDLIIIIKPLRKTAAGQCKDEEKYE